jgi:hypothetical protein
LGGSKEFGRSGVGKSPKVRKLLTAFSLTNECCLFRVVASTRLKIMRRTTLSSYEGNIGIQASLRGGLRRNAFDEGRSPL